MKCRGTQLNAENYIEFSRSSQQYSMYGTFSLVSITHYLLQLYRTLLLVGKNLSAIMKMEAMKEAMRKRISKVTHMNIECV